MAKRDIAQRRVYAENRMVEAIDRLLVARTDSERQNASKWAYAWRDFSQGSNHAALARSRYVHRGQGAISIMEEKPDAICGLTPSEKLVWPRS